MAKYWIKLWIELLDDPKIGSLPNHLWRRFIELLLVAGEGDGNGLLPTVPQMAWRLRVSDNDLVKSLTSLREIGVVELQGDRWRVTNFEKRQSRVPDAERKRQQRKRERVPKYELPAPDPAPPRGQNLPVSRDCHDDVTNCDIDTETETETESEADGNASEQKKPKNQVWTEVLGILERQRTPKPLMDALRACQVTDPGNGTLKVIVPAGDDEFQNAALLQDRCGKMIDNLIAYHNLKVEFV